jgi:hypothetical protein
MTALTLLLLTILLALALAGAGLRACCCGAGRCCSYGEPNCPGLILTGSNGTGTCTCFNGLSITLTPSPVGGPPPVPCNSHPTVDWHWTGSATEGCTGASISAVLSCTVAGTWTLSMPGTNCTFGLVSATTTPCGSTSGATVATFTGDTQNQPACCVGTVDWTVTHV